MIFYKYYHSSPDLKLPYSVKWVLYKNIFSQYGLWYSYIDPRNKWKISAATQYQVVLIIHLSTSSHTVVIHWCCITDCNPEMAISHHLTQECPQSSPADALPAHWLLLVSIACALKHLTVLIMKPFSTLFAVGRRKHSCFRFTGNIHASMRTHSNPENTEEWHRILCNHQLRTGAEANDAGSAVAEKSPEWLLIFFAFLFHLPFQRAF